VTDFTTARSLPSSPSVHIYNLMEAIVFFNFPMLGFLNSCFILSNTNNDFCCYHEDIYYIDIHLLELETVDKPIFDYRFNNVKM
jgi:hypothetical protein